MQHLILERFPGSVLATATAKDFFAGRLPGPIPSHIKRCRGCGSNHWTGRSCDACGQPFGDKIAVAPSVRMLSIERQFWSDLGIEFWKEQLHANELCVGPSGVFVHWEKCTKHERHECPRPLHDTVISFGDGLEECVLRPAFETLGILPNISRSKHLSFQSYSSYSEKREDFNFFGSSTFEHSNTESIFQSHSTVFVTFRMSLSVSSTHESPCNGSTGVFWSFVEKLDFP